MTDTDTGRERERGTGDGDAADAGGAAPDAALTDRVEAALRAVRDPDAGVNVFEAGIVEGVAVDGGEVRIEADLGEFDPEGEAAVLDAMLRAARTVDGVESVHAAQAESDPSGRTPGLASVDRVLAVASAKGGVGKSTVAVTLACALAAEEAVGVFDADIYGPNVPALLDVSGPVHADADDHPIPVERGGLEVMSVGLLAEGGPLAWRGAMAHDALTDLYSSTAWDDRDTVVLDLPPGTGDVVLTTLQEVPVDGVVFVTTPFHASVSDTRRSLELFAENDVPVLGTVVNMDAVACPNCGDTHDLFPGGDQLAALDTPVLARLPFTPELQETQVPGRPSALGAALAEAVEERFAAVWEADLPADALDLRGVPGGDRPDAVEAAFAELSAGDPFRLVSDRDPSPVRGFLADLAGVDPEAVAPFAVERENPETWVLETRRP